MNNLTASLEDYLEIIYVLEKERGKVGITDISKALSVSKPGVGKAVNALKTQQMITQEKYGKITLTPQGIQAACAVYQKHKMLSGFLTDVLGVTPVNAELDACKIEHILSNETLSCIEKFLNSKQIKIN